MGKSSITAKLVAIGVLCIVALGVFLLWFSVRSFQGEITRLNRRDYGERIRNIEYEYQAVDAVSMPTAQVYQAQEDLLQRLRDRYISTEASVPGAGSQRRRAYPFIINGDREVILHIEDSAVPADFFESEVVERIFEEQNGSFAFSYQGTGLWAVFSYFEPWDWYTGYILDNEDRFAAVRSFAISLIIAVAVGVLIVTGAFWFYTRRMIRPLRQMPELMDRVIQGDLRQRLPVTSRDEIGTIAGSFNDFVGRLAGIITSIQASSRENLQVEERLREDSEQAVSSLTQISEKTSSIKQSMLQLNRNVEQSSETMQRVTRGVRSLDESIDEQFSSVTESTSAVQQMSASLQNVAHITQTKTESSQRLQETVRTGGEKVENTRESIQEVTARIDDISNLVDIIKGIASQTNLLSMNAAIEAAHAGEAGKGFAVVAEEIRKLAEESSENSESIADIINTIIARIKEASQASEETSSAFESIDSEVEEVVNSFRELASSADELSTGSDEIQKSMSHLQELSGRVKEGSQESLEAADEIVSSMRGVIELASEVLQNISAINEESDTSVESARQVAQEASTLRDSVESLHEQIRGFRMDGSEGEGAAVGPADESAGDASAGSAETDDASASDEEYGQLEPAEETGVTTADSGDEAGNQGRS
jgi:methyl-accepting chemotaxis protein